MPDLPLPTWISQQPGDNVVFLHGMTMSPGFWETYAPKTLRRGRAASYPLPGHHPWSSLDPALLDAEAMADAYAAMIRRDFAGESVTLCGHSTGGMIALLLARHHPELVDAVILMGALSCGRVEGQRPLGMRLLGVPFVGRSAFRLMLRFWASDTSRFEKGSMSCVADPDAILSRPDDRRALESVRKTLLESDHMAIMSLVDWLSRTSLADALGNISQPVLNIVGGSDRVIAPLHQLQTQKGLPNAVTVILDHVGHLPMVEAPDRVDGAIAAFRGGLALSRAFAGAGRAKTQQKTRDVAIPGSGIRLELPA